MDDQDLLKCKPWSKDQGDYVVVHKSQFDPEFHELIEEEKPRATKRATRN